VVALDRHLRTHYAECWICGGHGRRVVSDPAGIYAGIVTSCHDCDGRGVVPWEAHA
jgi:DnaJ-class molecular chaperone